MTRARPAILLLLLAGCSGATAPQPAPTAVASAATPDARRPLPLPLPDVVARVNGQPILIRQILPLARSALARYKEKEERDQHKPEALRGALERYIDRELMLQEAIARGVRADTRKVDWAYDQMRHEHPEDKDWESFLLEQGLDPQSFKAELRAQHTVAALLADESRSYPISEQELRDAYDANPLGFSPEGAKEPQPFESVRDHVETALRQSKVEEVQTQLLARLRARAKIELFL
jgi:hypothetical protein